MNKRIIKYILNPPLWVPVLSFIIGAIFIALSIITISLDYEILGYFIYPFAFIFLAYTVYLFVRFFKPFKAEIKNKMARYEFTNSIITNYSFRTVFISLVTLVINVAFAVFNLVLGIIISSSFYIIMSSYYLFLSIAKYMIYRGSKKTLKLKTEKDKMIKNYKTYRSTGIFLIFMELVFIASIVQTLSGGKEIRYGVIITISFAAFTFTKLGLALYNVFKAKRTNNLIVQAFRNISLTDALATLMSMQVTLVTVYSPDEIDMFTPMNIVTGASIVIIGLSIGILMIGKANRKIALERNTNYE